MLVGVTVAANSSGRIPHGECSAALDERGRHWDSKEILPEIFLQHRLCSDRRVWPSHAQTARTMLECRIAVNKTMQLSIFILPTNDMTLRRFLSSRLAFEQLFCDQPLFRKSTNSQSLPVSSCRLRYEDAPLKRLAKVRVACCSRVRLGLLRNLCTCQDASKCLVLEDVSFMFVGFVMRQVD